MSTKNPQSVVGSVSTFTSLSESGTAQEVLHLPVSLAALGTENHFPPPVLEAADLSNWMRAGYFILDSMCIAQIPRNADDLPLDQNASEVTDVVAMADSLNVYYPVNREQAVCVSWSYPTDEWAAKYVDCRVQNGTIKLESLDSDGTRVWSISPDVVTEE
jgi:hypothetical protein